LRGAIYEAGFEPQFSGHETFPLRYSWLKKVYDAAQARASDPNNRLIFSANDAISNFGVGKNMVISMRYWALAARMLEDSSGTYKGPYRATRLGEALFGQPNGLDPYIEDPATLWLIHWQLASHPLPTTTIYFVFNHFHAAAFYRQQLTDEIHRYCDTINYSSKIAAATLKRDVDCFLRTYAARVIASEEDSLDSLLAELSLIRPIGKTDEFVLARGAKSTLPDPVFLYGLVSFACNRNSSRVFSVESLLHEPASPGRIFLLDEEALVERLSNIERLSRERISWSETAGLRQIIFHDDPKSFDLLKIVAGAYGRGRSATAA
jgi:hypothetical protein